jgi:arsenite methyltransferase
MAELRTSDPDATGSSCCSQEAQAACCEPSEKDGCCVDDPAGGSCACAAGDAGSGADIRETVREKYAAAARQAADAGTWCCEAGFDAADTGTQVFGGTLYGEEAAAAPAAAVNASLGCGVPTAVADLQEGETVLDLGSGAGADVLISARRVGPTGRAIGLDMTGGMLALARANAAEAGIENVEFVEGYLESIPLPDASVDVVISNCVINLSTDKRAVFTEIFRVLKPGGRIGVSDVVADDALTAGERAQRGEWAGCIAGALSFTEYRQGLEAAGFTGIEITPAHQVADGMHSAIIRAVKAVSADELA